MASFVSESFRWTPGLEFDLCTPLFCNNSAAVGFFDAEAGRSFLVGIDGDLVTETFDRTDLKLLVLVDDAGDDPARFSKVVGFLVGLGVDAFGGHVCICMFDGTLYSTVDLSSRSSA